MPETPDKAPLQSVSTSAAPCSHVEAASRCPTSHTSEDPGPEMSSGITDTAHESSQPAEPDTNCIHGINQVVLVIQPDDSTQYMLLSEERALREAAAKQAAQEAEEQGLVPVDPRDAAIMQAIEDGDAAVRRVFQERWLASLNRQFQCPGDLQPSEGAHQSSQRETLPEGDFGSSKDRWLAQLEAADMALTAQLNSRDAALSARI